MELVSRAQVHVVIPAYNEGAVLARVVTEVKRAGYAVVVVDDGSADDTAARAAAAGADVLRHAANQGKGAALVTGLRHLDAAGFERALTLDADGQHLPSEIPLLLAAADAAPGAIVVGVRRKEGFAIRRVARLGNWVADRFLRLIAGRSLPDTQSGFRVYPIATTLALGTSGSRYDFETEVLLRAARRGIDVRGVPVQVYYPPIAERVSHYRPWVDTLRIIGTVLRVLSGTSR